MLCYMRSLLPGYPDNPLFKAIFIDLLPANARDAAVKHELLEDMADAADKVLAEAPPVSQVYEDPGVNAAGLAPIARSPTSQAQAQNTPRKSRDPSLCYNHARYGRGAYKCSSPATCRMRSIVAKPPPASGNAKAGRQ